LSHALAHGMKDKGKYWQVPTNSYPELDQAVVILSNSHQKKEAAAFLEYLKGGEARSTFEHYGFSLEATIH
jgi:molybdate transport system substrate-binding protein